MVHLRFRFTPSTQCELTEKTLRRHKKHFADYSNKKCTQKRLDKSKNK